MGCNIIKEKIFVLEIFWQIEWQHGEDKWANQSYGRG